MVPGMHHCGGGPGPNTFDMLPMLEAWVEKGIAARPLCPHPQVARYSGQGSVDDAANFRCEAK